MRAAAPLAGLLLALLAVAGPALAQDGSPVVVEPAGPVRVALEPGDTAEVTFTLFNLNEETAFFVSISPPRPAGWEVDVSENRFFLGPREERAVTLAFTPTGPAAGFVSEPVAILIKNAQTGEEVVVERLLELSLQREEKVLGLFANPLPPPLDNEWGVFLLDVLFWVFAGVLTFVLSGRIVTLATRKAPPRVAAAIRSKLRVPIFLFVFLLGILSSFAVLPPFPFTDFVRKVLAILTFGVIGVYLLYKAFDALLYYVGQQVSPRASTKLDEVVLPLVRKFGLVIFLIIGTGVVMAQLGWDPTVLFAGAGIAGIAIAFAAQETISNLFSGVFLLLDRPFKEGDDIQLNTGEITRVERVGLRSTRLYFYRDHTVLVVPNKDLANTRITSLNYPDRKWKMNMEIGVAYGSDPELVKRILREAAEGHPQVVIEGDDAPIIRFNNFADSALIFLLRIAIVDLGERFQVAADLREAVYRRFAEEGVTIPFPQRTVWLHEAGAERGRQPTGAPPREPGS